MAYTVAVVGTHCTRKTTAVNYLSAAAMTLGRSVVVVPEVACTSPLAINENTTAQAQLWIATTQIAREIESGEMAPLLLTDGALVNGYAYLLRAVGAEGGVSDPFGLQKLVANWTARTGAFLFLRPDIAVLADGVRSIDEPFRADIDRRLAALLAVLVAPARVVELTASAVTPELDWVTLLETLAPQEDGR